MTVILKSGFVAAWLAFITLPFLIANGFYVFPSRVTLPLRTTIRFSTSEEVDLSQATNTGIPTSRFVVQNRFRVKKGREAAFEKRWADRESRLGTLPGFRFFCMLRRIKDGAATTGHSEDKDPNYVSCTVWEHYENFDMWRKGDAFKEAHGGGTIRGIASMLAATAMNTKGKPKPAYWRGLLPVEVSGNPPSDGEGWRCVDTDGKNMLPSECFVAMNRFSVNPGMEGVFEENFAARESSIQSYKGFRGFLLLRRDGGKKPSDGRDPDDGFTHSTFSVWEAKENFESWMSDSKKSPMNDGEIKKRAVGTFPSIYNKAPYPTFYEGLLVMESAAGV